MSGGIKKNKLEPQILEPQYRRFVSLLFTDRFGEASRLLESADSMLQIFLSLECRLPTTSLRDRDRTYEFLNYVAEARYSDAKRLYLENPEESGRDLRLQLSKHGANLIYNLMGYNYITDAPYPSTILRDNYLERIIDYVVCFPELAEIVRPMIIGNIPQNIQSEEFARRARMFYEAESR